MFFALGAYLFIIKPSNYTLRMKSMSTSQHLYLLILFEITLTDRAEPS